MREAAQLASVDRSVIDRAVRSGELTASDISRGRYRMLRISSAAIEEWMESRRVRIVASISSEAVRKKWFSKEVKGKRRSERSESQSR